MAGGRDGLISGREENRQRASVQRSGLAELWPLLLLLLLRWSGLLTHSPAPCISYLPTRCQPPSLQTSELEAEVAQLQGDITQLRQQYGKAQREVAAANQAEREARVVLSKAKSKQARAGRAGGIGWGSGHGKKLGRGLQMFGQCTMFGRSRTCSLPATVCGCAFTVIDVGCIPLLPHHACSTRPARRSRS